MVHSTSIMMLYKIIHRFVELPLHDYNILFLIHVAPVKTASNFYSQPYYQIIYVYIAKQLCSNKLPNHLIP